MLRQIYPERWLRIHSLPESKRYAHLEEEYVELLLRHNKVARDALGEGAQCYLIEGFWVEPEEHQSGWVVSLEGEEFNLRVEAAASIWVCGNHNALLRAVADCKTAHVLFASRESGCIYAPYDGGADLIYRNEQERNERRAAYSTWLSAHPAGL